MQPRCQKMRRCWNIVGLPSTSIPGPGAEQRDAYGHAWHYAAYVVRKHARQRVGHGPRPGRGDRPG